MREIFTGSDSEKRFRGIPRTGKGSNCGIFSGNQNRIKASPDKSRRGTGIDRFRPIREEEPPSGLRGERRGRETKKAPAAAMKRVKRRGVDDRGGVGTQNS